MPAYCFTGIHCIDRYSIILCNIILIRMCGACKITTLFTGFLLIFLMETIKNRKYKSDCSEIKGPLRA